MITAEELMRKERVLKNMISLDSETLWIPWLQRFVHQIIIFDLILFSTD